MNEVPPNVAGAFAAMGRGGLGLRPGAGIGAIGLVILCLVVYLPGFFALPPVDRDESRFAQASRQMYESVSLPETQRDPKRHGGGLVVPMVQDRARLNKPPLIYWLQSASAAVFSGGNPYRDSIWMYRVPSLIAAIIAVLATRKLGALIFDPAAGVLAATLLAVSPVIGWEARQARADMALLACTTTAMLALWRAFAPAEGERSTLKNAIVFWVALGLGIMTKGPITPLVAGMTALGVSVVSRRWKWMLGLRPWFGLPIVALIVGPWVYGVARHVGFNNYIDTIYRETIGRSTEPAEGHWGPPGYHLVFMPVLFWPGCLLTGLGVIVAARLALMRGQDVVVDERGRKHVENEAGQKRSWLPRMGHPGYLFLIAWLVPCWLVFELISTKLPHYTMPLYPALAILSARAALAADMKLLPGIESRWTRTGFGLWLCIGAAITFGTAAALITRLVIFPPGILSGLVLVVFMGVTVLLMLRVLRASWLSVMNRQFAKAVLGGSIVMVMMWLVLPSMGLPRIMGLSRNVSAALDKVDPGSAKPLAAIGYHEDSLVFLTRGKVERIDAPNAAAWIAQHPDGLIVRENSIALPEVPAMQTVGEVAGFNYSKGKAQRIVIEELQR